MSHPFSKDQNCDLCLLNGRKPLSHDFKAGRSGVAQLVERLKGPTLVKLY